MLLRYNPTIKRQNKRLIDKSKWGVTPEFDMYTIDVTTTSPHNLTDSSRIILEHNIKTCDNYNVLVNYLNLCPDVIAQLTSNQTIKEVNIKDEEFEVEIKKGYYWNNNGRIELINDSFLPTILDKFSSVNDKEYIYPQIKDDTKFVFTLKRYWPLPIKKITDYNSHGECTFTGKLPIFLKNGDTFYVYKINYKYEHVGAAGPHDHFLEVYDNPKGTQTYLGEQYVIFSGNLYMWQIDKTEIKCKYITENTFSYSYDDGVISKDDFLEVEDSRFVKHDDLNINIYEYEEFINLSIPISNNIAIGLNDESHIYEYFEDKKRELIPAIIDYEKQCFKPYCFNQKTPVEELKFNIYLRDRSSNKNTLETDNYWITSDDKGWTQYPLNDKGIFEAPEIFTNGDLLGSIGFTDDDVYLRKQKIEKSFLRLSFYNTNNPSNQMLLFYSTIFLDSGDLYTKYILNRQNSNYDKSIPMVNQSVFGDNNLTLSFSVSDRFNTTKSSEGFYLYLFPDGLDNNNTRTIYMKAEFHHAGNGETISLMLPHSNAGGKPSVFTDKNFPTSLISEINGDLTELFRQMFIPVNIKYNNNKGEYFYYFNLNLSDNKLITLDLYEPKINPLS